MQEEALRCPVCHTDLPAGDYAALGVHFVDLASASEDYHVMWLNRRVTNQRVDANTLAELLRAAIESGEAPPSQPRVRR